MPLCMCCGGELDSDLVFFVSEISSATTNEAHVVSYLAIWQATFHYRKIEFGWYYIFITGRTLKPFL